MPALRNEERKKSECINGVIFNMSPAPIYQHSVINGNIFTKIRTGLKDSLCLVFMENMYWISLVTYNFYIDITFLILF